MRSYSMCCGGSGSGTQTPHVRLQLGTMQRASMPFLWHCLAEAGSMWVLQGGPPRVCEEHDLARLATAVKLKRL